jgi:hypothetical protein
MSRGGLGGDLQLEGGGDEDVDLGGEEGVLVDRLGALVAGHAAGVLDVLGQAPRVDALGVDDGPGVVLDGDHAGAHAREDVGGVGAHVAKALHREGGAIQGEVVLAGPLLHHVHEALAGGLLAALGAARGEGLAGDHAPQGVLVAAGAPVHVGVHHPHHGLGVGAHVRRGDVVVGADVVTQRVGEAAGDALELGLAVLAGVELDAALGAAEGDLHHGALPGHPGGERLDLVEVHLGVVADARPCRGP